MFTDVIIGFDGSPPARDALALGRRLAEAADAAITVVCVHSFTALTADVETEGALDMSWRTGAERTLEEARALLAGVPAATFRPMADTSPARALHVAAQEADAALIVLGSTHRHGVGRVLPGTTADQVLHAAPCAVAVAPAGDDLEVETRLAEGVPAERLIAESGDLDLLVLGSRGFGPLHRVVLGTVCSAVLPGAACPVLVLPRRTAEELDDAVASLARAAAI